MRIDALYDEKERIPTFFLDRDPREKRREKGEERKKRQRYTRDFV